MNKAAASDRAPREDEEKDDLLAQARKEYERAAMPGGRTRRRRARICASPGSASNGRRDIEQRARARERGRA